MDVLSEQARAHLPALTPEQQHLVQQYPHYYKDVRHLAILDVYRVLDLFGVTDPCLQHAAKKCLCAGVRGAKDMLKDAQEARDTLNRKLAMADEDAKPAEAAPAQPAATPTALPDIGLQPHELRVVQELDELNRRIDKLRAFIGTPRQTPEFKALDAAERDAIQDQLVHMTRYAMALQRRVTMFRAKAEKREA